MAYLPSLGSRASLLDVFDMLKRVADFYNHRVQKFDADGTFSSASFRACLNMQRMPQKPSVIIPESAGSLF